MLKSLEVFGFKSFADRTLFEFARGITGVVGPNGSGKSNVVDSIKWILGDQSAKSLRGKEMTDVIFNGSASRKPAGFAEATLTFDNTKRILAMDQDEVQIGRRIYRSGEAEYLINRIPARLKDVKDLLMGTGAGTSAYSIIEQGRVDQLLQASTVNRRAVFEEAAGISRFRAKKVDAERKLERVEQNLLRLNDIVKEVEGRLTTMRTQAGKASKYRELSQELREWRVGLAADDYRDFTARLDRIAADRDALRDEIDTLSASATTLEQQQKSVESELATAEENLRAVEQQISENRQNVAGLEATIRHQEAHVRELDGEAARLEQQYASFAAKAEAIAQELAQTAESIEQFEHELESRRTAVQSGEQELGVLSQSLTQMRVELEERRGALLTAVRDTATLGSRLSGLDSHLAALDEQKQRLNQKLEQATRAAEQADAAASTHRLTLDSVTSEFTTAREVAEREQRTRDELLARQAASQQKLHDLKDDRSLVFARKAVLEELERKHEGLGVGAKEILARAKRGEGTPWRNVLGHVADMLDVDLENAALLEVALGSRAQLILLDDSDPLLQFLHEGRCQLAGQVSFLAVAHEPAFQSAPVASLAGGSSGDVRDAEAAASRTTASTAGPRSGGPGAPHFDSATARKREFESAQSVHRTLSPGQANRGESWRDAVSPLIAGQAANARLGAESPGDSHSPLPYNSLGVLARRRSRASWPDLHGIPGVVRRADELIRGSQVDGLASQLLADTWIVAALDIGLRLATSIEAPCRYVTLQGELIESNGTLHVGTLATGGTLLSRKGELRGVKAELLRLEQQIVDEEATLRHLTTAGEEATRLVREAHVVLEAVTERLAAAKSKQSAAELDAERRWNAVREVREELSHVDTTLSEIVPTRLAVREELLHREDEQQRLQQEITRREADLLERDQRHNALRRELSDQQLALVQMEEQRQSLNRARFRLDEEQSQRSVFREEVERRREESDQKRRRIGAEIDKSRDALNAWLESFEALRVQAEQLQEVRDTVRSRRGQLVEQEMSQRHLLRAKQDAQHTLQMQWADLNHQLANLTERLGEEYQIDVKEIAQTSVSARQKFLAGEPATAPAEGESSHQETSVAGSASPANAHEPDLVRAEIDERINRLKRRIKQLGQVSTDSLHELEELEGRFARLSDQLNDLVEAKATLEEIIRRINVESERLFAETFHDIRKHFQELFRKLFGGGEGDVVLENPDDILESGIDVVARPPGKELRSISLLSGGEKTMTAVALLLAMFKSKPSPFCILDEVDAALDEGNVERYLGILREFQKWTQFIVITHSKRTMSGADVLYGVTMEEAGISKRMSVRFDDIREDGHFKTDDSAK